MYWYANIQTQATTSCIWVDKNHWTIQNADVVSKTNGMCMNAIKVNNSRIYNVFLPFFSLQPALFFQFSLAFSLFSSEDDSPSISFFHRFNFFVYQTTPTNNEKYIIYLNQKYGQKKKKIDRAQEIVSTKWDRTCRWNAYVECTDTIWTKEFLYYIWWK